MSSRLVTEHPQGGAVACSELREDPVVEEGRDDGDEDEIERDTQLDGERRTIGELERRQGERVLDEHDAQHLEERRATGCNGGAAEGDERKDGAFRVARGQADRRNGEDGDRDPGRPGRERC